MKLKPRKILKNLLQFIDTDDIIVITGARQTGKTSVLRLLMEHTSPNLFIDLEDSRFRELCDSGYLSFINYLSSQGFDTSKRIFVYLDEIQYLKNPSEFLKLLHDHFPNVKLIVSGSSSFEIKSKFKDSLVGRTVNFELYPLDFQEFLWFNDLKINLTNVKDNLTKNQLKKLFEQYVLFGGYPKIVLTPQISIKEKYLQQIIDTYIYRDIRDIAKIRDIEKFNRLVRILASQSGNLLKINQLSIDISISKPTLSQYLAILENTYIVKRIYPFSKNVKSELTKLPKLFFIDSGLMNILIFRRLLTVITGQSFETAIFSEFLKNKDLGYSINFWRTKHGQEIDFILETYDKIFAIEVKHSGSKLLSKNLKKFKEKYPNALPTGICLENLESNDFCFYPFEIFSKMFNNSLAENS